MTRISLYAALGAVTVACAVLAPVAMAAPGQRSVRADAQAKLGMAAERTTYTAEYDASEYYGSVKCTGVHVVSKKFPGGKDIETCETTEGTLAHMKVGKGQTEFENTGGGEVTGWDSDDGGVETHEFTYAVSKNLKRFRIIAIY
jgi:hypothetical protein